MLKKAASKKLAGIVIIIAVVALGFTFFLPKEKESAETDITERPETTRFPSVTQKDADSQPSSKIEPTEDSSSQGIFKNYIEDPVLSTDFDLSQEIRPLIEDVSDLFGGFPVLQPQTETEPKIFSESELLAIKQEVFKKLYPDYFTDGLSGIQEIFIEREFLDTNYQKIENFDSEDKIFAFVNTIIDVLEEQDIYTKEEAEKFRTGANVVWKNLLKEEEELFLQELMAKSQLSKKIIANRLFNLRKSSSKKVIGIFGKIKNVVIKNVYALTVTSPDCYQEGPPMPIGSNSWAPCCNCGWDCSGHFIPDCGPAGRYCCYHLGCLNNNAGGWRSAIWDPATGICGVG